VIARLDRSAESPAAFSRQTPLATAAIEPSSIGLHALTGRAKMEHYKMPAQQNENDASAPPTSEMSSTENRTNELSIADWTRSSISVWSDIRFTEGERELRHPAMFPMMLVERLVRCYTKDSDRVILDPFLGSGSTLAVAKNLGRSGIGFEVYDDYIKLAHSRLSQPSLFPATGSQITIHKADARQITKFVGANSVDFCFTSPPYWDVLAQRRSADQKETRNYDDQRDLGLVEDYDRFADDLRQVFAGVYTVLRPGKFCVINVMDLRKGSRFFALHMDLTKRLIEIGFILDGVIIWDRRQEYESLGAVGFPRTFRINEVHEFLLVFQKPRDVQPSASQ
jgi:DNA modification methylase